MAAVDQRTPAPGGDAGARTGREEATAGFWGTLDEYLALLAALDASGPSTVAPPDDPVSRPRLAAS
jgi:hypothetical protein